MATFAFTPRPFYPSLSPQNREIRLLHLQPGTGDDAIECRLTVASLDSNPSYEALSYQWGRVPTNVSVDGHMVIIPLSLEGALQRVRAPDRERVLWADAICINQSDVAERNTQVALMADIYRQCERCLVYLGTPPSRPFDNPRDDAGFAGSGLPALLAALASKHHRNQPGAPPISPMFSSTDMRLRELIRAGWWTRIWVVQEVVLAPHSTALYGVLEIDFVDLNRAAEFVDEHDVGSAWTSSANVTDDLCHCMDFMKNKFMWVNLLEMRDRVFQLLRVNGPALDGVNASATASPAETQPQSVIDVMLAVRTRDCTDPRDKIFGILSLVRDWGGQPPIRADYTLEVGDLFLEFAKRMVMGEPGPKTLLLSQGIRPASTGMAGIPSWVPDWSQKGSGYDSYLWHLETQRQRTEGTPSVSIHGSIMRLGRGLSRGVVVDVTPPGVPLHKSYGQPPSMQDFQRFTGMIRIWSRFAGMQNELSLFGILRRHVRDNEDRQQQQEQQEGGEPREETDERRNPDEQQEPREASAAGSDDNGNDNDNDSDSGSYARVMRDMERCANDWDFMPDVQELFAFVAYHRKALRRIAPDELAFYRTLLHNNFPLHLRQARYHQEAVCVLRLLLAFYTMVGDPDRFLTRTHSVMLDKMNETLELIDLTQKRLFRTGGGLLGIAPKDVQEGDEIFSFEGIDTTFVLRSVGAQPVDAKGEQPCYKLVGYCYVDQLDGGMGWEGAQEIYLQ